MKKYRTKSIFGGYELSKSFECQVNKQKYILVHTINKFNF